jgi:AbrB family looped-hinge helix DNA binding protein
MLIATMTLSSKGQVVIPKEIRDEMHWVAGTKIALVSGASGVMLKEVTVKTGRKFEDLIGMLKQEGPPVPTDVLCMPVDNSEDWDASEKRGG